ncbi:DUF6415 family natural product biosynthesis protein [Streptomyces olindensis]|uniref:DUF6415 family natural product biosynthesis protein n=1 Tax=Streptomyces olindensis TaxID=358823 RepID=UPI0033C6F332
MTAPATEALPLDLEVMRACAERVLAADAEALSLGESETLTLQLRGHLMLVITEIETEEPAPSEGDAPGICAFFCIGEGRLRLRAEAGPTPSARIAHAQVLARSVIALCDHYENGDHQCPSGPERAAYLRMLLHCPECPACRTVNDDGEAIGTCETADRLYAEYRQARRGHVPVPASETVTGGRRPDRDGM